MTSPSSPLAIDLTRSALRAGALIVISAAALFLGGCETTPIGAPSPTDRPTAAVAERAEAAGEYVIAAREYDRLAQIAPPNEAPHFQLKAAETLIKAGELAQARTRLRAIAAPAVDPTNQARRHILEARLALAEGQQTHAIVQLNDAIAIRNLSPNLLAEIYQTRAHAELALNNPIAAVRDLIAREQYIADKNAVAENQRELWDILQNLSVAQLRSEISLARDPILVGWLALAQLHAENAANSVARDSAIARWRAAFPNHPASTALLDAVTSAAPVLVGRIERIALLLPLTSNYAVAAQAVRDGFMGMHTASTDPNKPSVTVYDIGADPSQAPAFYQRAVQDGAQIVVGPLGREAAEAIVRSNRLPVPTLLLSHTDERPNGAARLFQFGLPPEQEARQAAERAYLDGCRQAAVLYPENPWGERMAVAFSVHWQRLGGGVLATQAYREDLSDYSEPIKQMLNVSQSEMRKALLEKRVGRKLQFAPRARQDLECIFMAADARRGRLIKPQLNYHHAKQIPVYATSHVYTGKPDPVQDADLDGVLFGDMPWMLVASGRIGDLKRTVQGEWPHVKSDLDRLYALGVDSYGVLPHLNRLGTENAERYAGVTSALSLDPEGRLHRSLAWARFRNGVPRLLDAR